MDPNANLAEQRRIAAEIIAEREADTPVDSGEIIERAQRLADLVAALDEWISKGGFLPAAWVRS